MATEKKTAGSKARAADTKTAAGFPGMQVPGQFIEFQKSLLGRQKSLFDTTYERVSDFQQAGEERVTELLQKSPLVPREMTQIAEQWNASFQVLRESYKSSVDKSFELAEQFYDGLPSSS